MRLYPLLDYKQYRQIGNESGSCKTSDAGDANGRIYRFTGRFESITDGKTLWVRSDELTIPVSLEKTQCWLFPIQKGEGGKWASLSNKTPELIRWNRISTISESAKIFIGGELKIQNNRPIFVSSKENPLKVIFYNCSDEVMTESIIRTARAGSEYWNRVTPVSLAFGAIALLYIAASFLNRPAFRLTVISALVSVFIPVLPVFPPGFLFTTLYRRMAWQARRYRVFRDLSRLPLRYLKTDRESTLLYNGENYGYLKTETTEKPAPLLVPEITGEYLHKKNYIFGVLNDESPLPVKSKDPFVSFGLLPDLPQNIVKRYTVKAYMAEIFAWFFLLLGIIANIIFIFMILSSLA